MLCIVRQDIDPEIRNEVLLVALRPPIALATRVNAWMDSLSKHIINKSGIRGEVQHASRGYVQIAKYHFSVLIAINSIVNVDALFVYFGFNFYF